MVEEAPSVTQYNGWTKRATPVAARLPLGPPALNPQ